MTSRQTATSTALELRTDESEASMATTGRYLAALRAAKNPYADTLAQQLGLND